MTTDEVIYCLQAVLPERDFFHCHDCPYYHSTVDQFGNFGCKKEEAHRIAIEVLRNKK